MPETSTRQSRGRRRAQLTLAVGSARYAQSPDRAMGAVVMGEVASLNAASRPDGSWAAGTLLADDGATRIAFVGTHLGVIAPGDTLRLRGKWETHPTFGNQFRAISVETALPQTMDGVVRFMTARIRGCGAVRAARIVEQLGDSCLERLRVEPELVLSVFPGKVGERMVDAWREWAAKVDNQEYAATVRDELEQAGFTRSLARRILAHFPSPMAARQAVLHHPYRLVDVPGIGFRTADRRARAMGVAVDDPSRVAAGVVYALQVAMGEGHSGMPRDRLERRALVVLEIGDAEAVRQAVDHAIEAGTLVGYGDLLYLPAALHNEKSVALSLSDHLEGVGLRLSPERRGVISDILESSQLTATQSQAVWHGFEHRCSVLTGRPGSGKTTTLRTYIKCCEALDIDVELAAPTGKAASRASEVTGLAARTIHRMIGCPLGQVRDEPIDADVIIVDEMSMVDLDVFAWLLRNIDLRRSILLLVGDNDQLPSVGHGRVFADIIDSGRVPTTNLTGIFRQGADSQIVQNAHRLLDGRDLVFENSPTSDCWFADVTEPPERGPDGFPLDDPDRSGREQAAALERLHNAVAYLVRDDGANPVRDIQVLTPMRRGLLGCDNLNAVLQESLNPDGRQGPMIGGDVRVRTGDRVIQTKNDYSVGDGLFNGEQGEVVDVRDGALVARFDGRDIALAGPQLSHLRLAWAITIHRSQGSEFPYTVLLYHTSHFVMLNMSLLYTGMTRAQKRLLILGSQSALDHTRRAGRTKTERFTGLAELIGTFSPVGASQTD